MNSSLYLIIAIAIIALVTLLTRALPFIAFGNRKLPAMVKYLGNVLPPCIMVILVYYCLKGIHFTSPGGFLPELSACLIVTIMHLWKKNMYLSIIIGTICYMIMIRVIA